MPTKKENNIPTYVIGDIHGANKALQQCLERSGINLQTDKVICLGDVCDGWPDVYESIETLTSIKNLVYIMGNHDYWALNWMKSGKVSEIWYNQGGNSTINSYKNKIPKEHVKFLSKAFYFHVEKKNCFVHGGINPKLDLYKHTHEYLMWNRDLVNDAISLMHKPKTKLTKFENVFVGHTPTLNFNSSKPIKACDVYLMDTGAGWHGGKLSIMDISTNEIFQSDFVHELYPDTAGRMKF